MASAQTKMTIVNTHLYSRPSHDTSPPEQKKFDIVQHGVVAIETKDFTHRWAIWETLGFGGFGVVMRGVSLHKDRTVVALKFMKRLENCSKYQLAELDKTMAREVAVLTEIQHENVIRMLHHFNHAEFLESDYSTTDSTLLVLEYASKGSLHDFLKATGAFPEGLARTYFHQMVSGLEALHVKGFAHFDLNQKNMLFDEHYTLKLADFGLAKKFYGAKEKKAVDCCGFAYEYGADYGFGRYEFRAPEINMKSKCYGNQIDIFALGVTLFVLCFGFHPFEIADAGQDMHWRLLSEACVLKMQKMDLSMIAQKHISSVEVHCPVAAQRRTKFWTLHGLAKVNGSDLAALLIAMMYSTPFEFRRYDIFQVRKSKWLSQDKPYSRAELKPLMDARWKTVCTHKYAQN